MKSITDYARLRNNKATLMTKLKKLGYTTYGYSANSFISRAFGFEGFDVLKNWEVPWHELLFKMNKTSIALLNRFIEKRRARDFVSLLVKVGQDQPKLFLSTLLAGIKIDLDRRLHSWPKNKGLRNIIDFIKRTKFKEPFFLFLNILEVHEPYFENDNLTDGIGVRSITSIPQNELDLWTKGYDSQVHYVAEKIPGLFKALESKGLFDNTLIILTSDHGQLLGEHGWIGHGVFLYDELVEVPLLVKYPRHMKVDRKESNGLISLTAIPNFILDIADGRITDSSLFSPQVFSESWAHYLQRFDGRTEDAREIDLTGRRICIFSKNGKLTYNLNTQKIEESTLENESHKELVMSDLVDKILKFTTLNDRLLATSMSANTGRKGM